MEKLIILKVIYLCLNLIFNSFILASEISKGHLFIKMFLKTFSVISISYSTFYLFNLIYNL